MLRQSTKGRYALGFFVFSQCRQVKGLPGSLASLLLLGTQGHGSLQGHIDLTQSEGRPIGGGGIAGLESTKG